jgi:hypothetical protein
LARRAEASRENPRTPLEPLPGCRILTPLKKTQIILGCHFAIREFKRSMIDKDSQIQ